jgi:hypothetical protein
MEMVPFWRKSSLLRECVGALLCALVLLAGVMQARAGTEIAAKSGFASAFTLCQQNGMGSGSPEPDPNCDHCRVPTPLTLGSVAVTLTCLRVAMAEDRAWPTSAQVVSPRILTLEARGPPHRG